MTLLSSPANKIQALKDCLVSLEKNPTHVNYCLAESKIKSLKLAKEDLTGEVKIALLSNFTWQPLDLYLRIDSIREGLLPHLYLAPYDQYWQEIGDAQSGLYSFQPEVVILALHGKDYFKEIFERGANQPDRSERLLEQKISELVRLLETLAARFPLVIVPNFCKPSRTFEGLLGAKLKNGTKNLFNQANALLVKGAGNYDNLQIMDFEGFVIRHGEAQVFDERLWYASKNPFRREIWPVLSREYLRFIKAFKGLTRKCLALDLDNTLWGGILGEDGPEGIKLGPGGEGEAFLDFQREILNLTKQGILLAINSKNNEKEVWEVFKKHPHMVLKKEHFAAWKINWKDKASNLKALAEEMNLGLDSFVYLDDHPAEVEWIKENLPEVLAVTLPSDPAQHVKVLHELDCFEKLSLTEEDKDRTKMYWAESQRKDLKHQAPSLEDFYRHLQMAVCIKEMDSFSKPRVVQLLARTNQFNMTTKRYTDKEIESMGKDSCYLILTLGLQDRFGDSGMVGLMIVKKENPAWRIDSLLLSCRVLGRHLEKDFLSYLIKRAKEEKIEEVRAQFVPTKKNEMARDFYRTNQFQEISSQEGTTEWSLKVNNWQGEISPWLKIEA